MSEFRPGLHKIHSRGRVIEVRIDEHNVSIKAYKEDKDFWGSFISFTHDQADAVRNALNMQRAAAAYPKKEDTDE